MLQRQPTKDHVSLLHFTLRPQRAGFLCPLFLAGSLLIHWKLCPLQSGPRMLPMLVILPRKGVAFGRFTATGYIRMFETPFRCIRIRLLRTLLLSGFAYLLHIFLLDREESWPPSGCVQKATLLEKVSKEKGVPFIYIYPSFEPFSQSLPHAWHRTGRLAAFCEACAELLEASAHDRGRLRRLGSSLSLGAVW